MRTWREAVREDAWIYISVPLLITALIASFAAKVTPRGVALILAMNFLISVCIGACIHVMYRVFGPRFALEKRGPGVRWIFHGLAIGGGVLTGTEVALRLGSLISPELLEWFPRVAVVRVAVPVSIAIVAIGLAQDKLRNRAKEVELREERAKRELLGAQLEALVARTNPHFLFNSLNTVAALIAEDPARAERAVERLSSLFRYALDGSKKPRVALESELEAVESYLAFEELRFGERLTARMEIDPAARAVMVPPFVLQPLVENAVNHGVASKKGPGRVDIRARVEQGGRALVLEVEDDGPGAGGSTRRGAGTAQADLEARLKLNYGDRAQLIRGPGQPGGAGYLARIVIPIDPEEKRE